MFSRAYIAVVPEEANAYLGLSVWQSIMLMVELHGVARHRRTQEAERLLDALGLAESEKYKPHVLSKALRQTLILCAALLMGPQALVLDGPPEVVDVLPGGDPVLCPEGVRVDSRLVVVLSMKALAAAWWQDGHSSYEHADSTRHLRFGINIVAFALT